MNPKRRLFEAVPDTLKKPPSPRADWALNSPIVPMHV